MQRTTHELSIMGEYFLHHIMLGNKKYEGRIYSEKCRSMKVGDLLKLYEKEAGWGIVCTITSLDTFSSFKDMLETLGVLAFVPHLEPLSHTISRDAFLEKAILAYKSFPGAERVDSLGCVAIGVSFLHKY
jgi:ASC-1-like (ASCH) protein